MFLDAAAEGLAEALTGRLGRGANLGIRDACPDAVGLASAAPWRQ